MTEEEAMEFIYKEGHAWAGRLRLRESGQDVAQGACLKLWEAKKWPPTEALAAVTVKHHAFDLAKVPVWDEVPLEERHEPVYEPPEDRKAWLDGALKHRSWLEQKAIRMRLQGCTLGEISRGVGMSPDGVRRLMEQTAKELAQKWKGQDTVHTE